MIGCVGEAAISQAHKNRCFIIGFDIRERMSHSEIILVMRTDHFIIASLRCGVNMSTITKIISMLNDISTSRNRYLSCSSAKGPITVEKPQRVFMSVRKSCAV